MTLWQSSILFTYPMATPYNPSYQSYPPQGQAAYPPPVDYGNPPQNQGASAQYPPPPTVQGYPPQGYPPEDQDDLPPAYPAHKQDPPPAYDSEADQLAYTFQPQPPANTTVVVTAQPVTTTTTSVSHESEEKYSGLVTCSLLFAIGTAFVCGGFLISMVFSLVAILLTSAALKSRGKSRRNKAAISIAINVIVVVVGMVVIIVIVATVTPGAVARSAARRADPSLP